MAAPKRFRIPTLQEMDEDLPGETIKIQKTSVAEKSGKDLLPKTTDVKLSSSSVQNRALSSSSNTSSDVSKTRASESSNSAKNVIGQDQTEKDNEPSEATNQPAAGIPAPNKSSNSLLVNPRQRGNPILKSVRNIAWEYSNIVPDYVMGQANCALFLSLRYHQLHPNYIHERLKQLGRSYELRVMLVQVDVKDPQHLLSDLAKICILADCTMILAFSVEEAGRYLETYKIFENKPAEALMEKIEDNYMAKFTDCLTRVKSVNKTDCSTLLSHFGSLSNIADASEEDLSLCPGFGPQKAQRLHSLFHEPFLRSSNEGSTKRDGSSPRKTAEANKS